MTPKRKPPIKVDPRTMEAGDDTLPDREEMIAFLEGRGPDPRLADEEPPTPWEET